MRIQSWFFLFLLLLPLFSLASQEQIARDVETNEFARLIEKGEGLLLDVRTPEEFEKGHIEGAVNLDYHSEDFATRIDSLDRSRPVYVYCRSGGRSSRTMMLMETQGFVAVYNMLGGYRAWMADKE